MAAFFLCAILPFGYNDLRAVRYRDIRENAECVLPLRLYPYAIAVLRAVLVSHPSGAECFPFAEFVLQLQ